jgi:hypothetical protein
MFDSWKKAKAVSASKQAIQPILKTLQYRPFDAPQPITGRLWGDPFFVGFFFNVIRYWSRVYLGREPEAKEFSQIFGDTTYGVSRSSDNATAALKMLKTSLTGGPTENDFIRGATTGLKFVNLIVGNNEFDEDEEVQEAKRGASAIGGHEATSADTAGIYFGFTVKKEYTARFGTHDES